MTPQVFNDNVLIYDDGTANEDYDPMFMDIDPVLGIQMWSSRSGDGPEHAVMFLFTEHQYKTATLSAERARELGEALCRFADVNGK